MVTILLLFVSPGTTIMSDIKQPIDTQPQVCVFSRFPNRLRQFNCTTHVTLCMFSQATAPMQLGGNRNAKNCPIGPDGKRDWSFGLFDCFGRCSLCKFDPSQNFYSQHSPILTAPRARRLPRCLVPVCGLQQEQAASEQLADPRHSFSW